MGIAYNPSIVTNGLVLCLDAGNTKSVPRNNILSTWTDYGGNQANYEILGDYSIKLKNTSTSWVGYYPATVSSVGKYIITFTYYSDSNGSSLVLDNDGIMDNTYNTTLTANTTPQTYTGSVDVNTTGNILHFFRRGSGGNIFVTNVSYFKLETTWTDLSGNGNNGTLTNGPTYRNNIISLDATDDTISFPFDLNYIPALSNFSMEIWMRIDTFPTPTASANQYGNYQRAGVLFGSMYYGGVAFYWTGNSTGTSMNVYPVIRGQDAYRNATLISINLNTWYNLVLVNNYSSSKFQFYVNGSLYSEVTGPTQEYNPSFVSVAGNIGISKPQVDGGGTLNYSYLDCDVAVAKIYKNKALTASEVQQNFNATRARFGI